VVPSVHVQIDGTEYVDRVLDDLELRGIVPDKVDVSEELVRQLPPGSEFFVAERMVSPWGTRFFFGASHRSELLADRDQVETTPLAVEQTPGPAGVLWTRGAQVVSVPIAVASDDLGFVELSKGPDMVAQAVATARRALLLAGGGTMLLAVVVGLVVSGWLTRPLQELTGAATEMSGSDLSIRAPVRRDDEIGQLAAQFNRMAQRLETSFSALAAERDTLRRFIADASHELRTPITALRNFNELMQGAAAEDREARREFLAESEKQLERLAWITDNLLNLSRIEAGLVALDIAEHDARELIRAVVSAFRPQAEEKSVKLVLTLPETELPVRCDRHRVEVALSNLLDNAVKFTPPGGQVTLGAEHGDRGVRIWVEDSGPGIAPEDLPHVFDRFYRGRGKREGPSEGSGLGLAIARGIVEAHGGRVSAASRPRHGSRFTLELPINPQEAQKAS
jgi:signal transduction histidine kinase